MLATAVPHRENCEFPCIGYLDHPFKNLLIENENDLPPLLAITGGLVYNPKSSTASSCSNDDPLT
jgi:hypothetical protein